MTGLITRREALERLGTVAAVPVGLAGLEAAGPAASPSRDSASPRTGEPVIVGSAPLAAPTRGVEAVLEELGACRAAGADVVVVPVATVEHLTGAARNLLALHGMLARARDVGLLVERADDLRSGQASGRVAVVAQFQGLQMMGQDLDLVPQFAAAGVRIMAPTHNWKNWNGDGCFERTDLRLTELGVMAVRAMNRAGVVVDLSHVGRRSSLHAMEVSEHPVVFTHSNAAQVHSHPRNLSDEQIDACAAGGGVIGLNAFAPYVSADPSPTVEDVLQHLDHIASRVGIEHVGIGLDFAQERSRRFPSDPPLPPPTQQYPRGLWDIRDLESFSEQLTRRGLDHDQRAGVLGGNFARVFARVWGGAP